MSAEMPPRIWACNGLYSPAVIGDEPAPSAVEFVRADIADGLLCACRCALGHMTGNMDGEMDLGDPVEMLRTAIARAEAGRC